MLGIRGGSMRGKGKGEGEARPNPRTKELFISSPPMSSQKDSSLDREGKIQWASLGRISRANDRARSGPVLRNFSGSTAVQ